MDIQNHRLILKYTFLLTKWSQELVSSVTDLKHRVGEKQPVPDVVQEFGARAADGVELQDFLGGLGLAGSALP